MRGYVNGAAVLTAEGFECREWVEGWGWWFLQAARSFTDPPAREADERRKIQPRNKPSEAKHKPASAPSVHCPSIPHSSAPPLRHFSPLFPQIGKNK